MDPALPDDLDSIATPEDLVTHLNRLKVRAGDPSLRTLAADVAKSTNGKRHLPISTMSEVLTGKRWPKLPLLSTFVEACGDSNRLNAWVRAWTRVTESYAGRAGTLSPQRNREFEVQQQLADAQQKHDDLARRFEELQHTHEETASALSRSQETLQTTINDHLLTLRLIAEMTSDLDQDLDDLEVAHLIYERVVRVRTTILGDEHPDTLTAINNLATVLGDQAALLQSSELSEGDDAHLLYDRAVREFERLIEIRRRTLGSDHPDTVITIENLATTLANHGDHAAARQLFHEVATSRRASLGDDHPDTIRVVDALSQLNN